MSHSSMSKSDVLPVSPEVVLEKSFKKEKKSKSKKKGEVTVAVEVVQDESMVVDSEDTKKRKKEKKDKKKRSAKVDEKEVLVRVDGSGSNSSSEPGSGKASTFQGDTQASSEAKKDKKRKRKLEAGGELEDSSKKGKKKRKKEENGSSSSPQDTALPAEAPTPASKNVSATGPTSAKDTEEFMVKHSITIYAPVSDPTPVSPIVSFDQLISLPQGLKDAFKGFKEPSPIQACTWPPALAGKDVVGIAETGSGKTLAFGIPALNALINSTTKIASSNITTLIVAPTRELAIQTHDTLSALGQPFGIASVAIFGGVPKERQVKMLQASLGKGRDGLLTRIVVGTPGRILDLMQEGTLDIGGVNYLVLDEADRMLDKGFENDIRRIIEACKPPEERQTMMFSATWPEAVRRLASTFQRDPVRVTVGSDDLTANSRVEQSVEVFEDNRSKDQRLLGHLKKLMMNRNPTKGIAESRVLVFALYKKETSRVEQVLQRQGYAVGALHGDMSQPARMEALDKFKTGVTNLLVATDVAARGLDIPNVAAVINYTFPLTIEDYIHRIGRTGRGGKTGRSITFFTGDGHERALAGEYARVLREGGFDYEALKKFPMTIKKKEHSVYGAFFRDDIPVKTANKIVF